MTPGPLSYFLIAAFGLGAVVAGWLVFRTDSMLRAAYWLMVSFVGVGAMLIVLDAQFLGLILILMMSGEMTIMAIFMIMFMMNPAGLNPMTMVHQHRTSILAGVGSFLVLAWVGVVAEFPNRPAPVEDPTVALGEELLGRSMLIFESAGVALLAVMIGAIALAAKQGRFGDAFAGSVEPELDVEVGDRT
ncbi:MAG TPA: NADH-quinone oxidoreductase subunit J [Actinobacteria bacterium]|nr:NADH:ubiquinone oxidoreductase subunit J [bacterium BMS3Bbin02]HDL42081.1 NADH-quinone oxidoreductase subunit J [Actinomycetota bacterium]